jgi:hypothetical protein
LVEAENTLKVLKYDEQDLIEFRLQLNPEELEIET